jgi:hypothetical protein
MFFHCHHTLFEHRINAWREREIVYIRPLLYYLLSAQCFQTVHIAVSVCPSVPMMTYQLLNHLTDFLETWYEHYERGHHNVLFLDFVQSVISAWRAHEILRWGAAFGQLI